MAAIAQVITRKHLFSQTPTLRATVNRIMSVIILMGGIM